MTVIAVLNQKGGAGKTTIATHLARGLQMAGKETLLVDSDPQGSARDWAAMREQNTELSEHSLTVVGMDRPTIERDIKALTDADYIIIDGAPQLSNLAVSAVKAADVVLIPVQPSPYDIWATSELVDLVKARMEITEGRLKAAFIVSRAVANSNIGREISDVLNGYDLPILETRIHQRVDYPGSAASGSTVLEERPRSEAAREILELIAEVQWFAHEKVSI